MLKIQEELGLRETAFYREAFEEGLLEGEAKGEARGEAKGERKGKLATVPLLRELGLSDEVIAERLQLPLADVQGVPR